MTVLFIKKGFDMLYLILRHFALFLILGGCSQVECIAHAKDRFDERFFGVDKKTLRKIDGFDTRHNTRIAILKNKNSKLFIVKQETRSDLFLHMAAVYDRLGSYVGQSVNVPVNRVEIIPRGYSYPGKDFIDLPATLHEVVPGVQVQFLPKDSKWRSVSVHQIIQNRIPENERGLTQKIVQSMAMHPDLPKIVAFDTFIANVDRHNRNLFYDQKSNHFFAIDLEYAFEYNVAMYACRFISSLIAAQNTSMSVRDLRSLRSYKDVLSGLIKHYSPESLHEKMISFAVEANLITRSSVETSLYKCKQKIAENYASCKELVALLDKLFIKYSNML